MKRFILPLLVLLFVGSLFAVESAPSEVVGYVKYDCVAGLNLVALPMDQGYAMASELGAAYAGLTDAISYWDATNQRWYSAVYYADFEMWDPDFSVAPGSVLMINALSPYTMYSIGDLPATNAQYTLVAGLNTLMVPLNESDLTLASELGSDIGVTDAISYWDATLQRWYSAVYYADFEMWDPDFSVGIGMPVMANSLSGTTWPSR
ncbi:MAG: hypothetical protein LHW43_01085, partial [Candidatus Cloacimonetes bacterium]|nr:hypothetical protein [Candidatus Cloacimonadota bacterium]